jgi:hypothetical protein
LTRYPATATPFESVEAPQLTETSRPMVLDAVTLGVAPWWTLAAAASPELPAVALALR